MSSTETFDGLCGLKAPFGNHKVSFKCLFELGHSGPCSWEKYRDQFVIMGGSFSRPDPERGFIESVLFHEKK